MKFINGLFFFIFVLIFLSCKNEVVLNLQIDDVENWAQSYYSQPENNYLNYIEDYIVISLKKSEIDTFDKSKPLKQRRNIIYDYKGVYFVDIKNGEKKWNIKKGKPPILIVDNYVYLIEDDFTDYIDKTKKLNTKLNAYDITTRKMIWSVSGHNLHALYLSDGDYLIVSEGKKIIKFVAKTGKKLWATNIDDEYFSKYRGACDQENNILYIPTFRGLVLLDIFTGKIVKTYKSFLTGNIVIDKGVAIVQVFFDSSSKERGLLAIDTKTKDVIWKLKNINFYHTSPEPIIFNNVCYVATSANIVAINVRNGKVLWKNENKRLQKKNLTKLSILPLRIINNNIYRTRLGSNCIKLLDPLTGNVKQKYELNNPLHSMFTYKEGIVYYRSKNMLYAEKVDF